MATVTCGMRELPNVVQTILPAASGGISKLTTQKRVCFLLGHCSGQNKNRPVAAMHMLAVATLNVDRIYHYFLERGHTEKEGDSVHSTIERAARRVNIYTPWQWFTVVASAKRQGAYQVIEMAEEMKDYKSLCSYYLTQTTYLQWSHIKCMKVEKAIPD